MNYPHDIAVCKDDSHEPKKESDVAVSPEQQWLNNFFAPDDKFDTSKLKLPEDYDCDTKEENKKKPPKIPKKSNSFSTKNFLVISTEEIKTPA